MTKNLSASIIPLGTNSTKAEEINFMYAVAQLSGEGSYMGMLFNQRMIDWLEDKIKNDFSCDLIADYVKAEEEAVQIRIDMQGQISSLKGENAELKREIKIINQDKDTILKANDACAELIEKKNDEIRQTEDQVYSLGSTIDSLQDVVKERDETIIRLKAQLWDMSH
jgi:peptidoglycan hydrolase CwlO-like protein